MLLKNAGGQSIVPYCVFDSDYHTSHEKKERQKGAVARGIQLHIWCRKEIENYLLAPSAVARAINSRRPSAFSEATSYAVAEQLDRICDGEKNTVFDAMATHLLSADRQGGVTKANRLARETVDRAWRTLEGKLAIVSGKMVITELSQWSKATYGVSLSARAIITAMLPSEIPDEISKVLSAIEYSRGFSS